MSEPVKTIFENEEETALEAFPDKPYYETPTTEKELELIERELVIRERQYKLREKEIDNAHEFSVKTMEANVTDREKERNHYQQTLKISYQYIFYLFLILTALISYALYLNKDQFVMELVKALIFLLTGGIGGYSIQKLLPKKDESSKGNSTSKKDDGES